MNIRLCSPEHISVLVIAMNAWLETGLDDHRLFRIISRGHAYNVLNDPSDLRCGSRRLNAMLDGYAFCELVVLEFPQAFEPITVKRLLNNVWPDWNRATIGENHTIVELGRRLDDEIIRRLGLGTHDTIWRLPGYANAPEFI